MVIALGILFLISVVMIIAFCVNMKATTGSKEEYEVIKDVEQQVKPENVVDPAPEANNVGEPVVSFVKAYKANPERFKGLAVGERERDKYLIPRYNSHFYRFIIKDAVTKVVYRIEMVVHNCGIYKQVSICSSPYSYTSEKWLTSDEQEYIITELKPLINQAIADIEYNLHNLRGKKFYKETNRREELMKLYCNQE